MDGNSFFFLQRQNRKLYNYWSNAINITTYSDARSTFYKVGDLKANWRTTVGVERPSEITVLITHDNKLNTLLPQNTTVS